jgi:hypothetical protein
MGRGKKSVYRESIKHLLPVLNNSQISRIIGCSREYARQIRVEGNIHSMMEHQQCSMVLNEDKLTKVINLLNTGNTLTMAARAIEVNPASLSYLLKKYGIAPSVKWAKKGKYSVKAVECRKKGMTADECAKQLGISTVSVFRVWKSEGLTGNRKMGRRKGWKKVP